MKLPEGYHTITPYFTVSDADQLLEFLVEAFGGAIVAANRYPTRRIQHARVRVGDSVIMLNESNEQYPINVSQMQRCRNSIFESTFCRRSFYHGAQ